MARVFKNAGVQRARVYASFGPVWVATHGVDLDLEFEFNLKLNYPLIQADAYAPSSNSMMLNKLPPRPPP